MADTTGIDWQRQSFAKGGKPEAAPSQINPKTWGGPAPKMNSKIAKPTHPCGGMVKGGYADGGMVRGYADGGEVDDATGVDAAVAANTDNGEWARGENYGDGTTGDERVAMAKKSVDMTGVDEKIRSMTADNEPAEAKVDAPRKQSFKEAFAAAKKGSTFEWNGKQYKKEFASEKKVVDYGDEAKRLEARYPASKTAARPVRPARIDTTNIDSKTLLPKR